MRRCAPMIEIHLYGKLRRFAEQKNCRADSVVAVEFGRGATIRSVLESLGVPKAEIGSNIFRNGRYSTLDSYLCDDDRLGIFPDDMQLLYKWYFEPEKGKPLYD